MAAIRNALGPRAPAGLVDALVTRHARVTETWALRQRHYVVADSSGGPIFARYSAEPRDHLTFAFESSVRDVVGSAGDLRSPPVLERGSDWLLEKRIVRQPFGGVACVDRALAAATRISTLDLPEATPHTGESRRSKIRRRVRTTVGPVPLGDVVAAKHALSSSTLPLAPSHGDFHNTNLLYDGTDIWVVDWELTGPRPAGFDLMYLWATVVHDADREQIFAAATELFGTSRRQGLLRLRFALAVTAAVNMLTTPVKKGRRPEDGRRLVQMLPALRREAGL